MERITQTNQDILQHYLNRGDSYGVAYKKTYKRDPSNVLCEVSINSHPRVILGMFKLSRRTINRLKKEFSFIRVTEHDYCESATDKYKDVIRELNKFLKKPIHTNTSSGKSAEDLIDFLGMDN